MNFAKNFVGRNSRQFFYNPSRNTASTGEVAEGYFKLKDIQAKFQKNDGKPVFLKGGTFDQILYRLTMGLSVVGIGGVVKLLYDLSQPQQ